MEKVKFLSMILLPSPNIPRSNCSNIMLKSISSKCSKLKSQPMAKIKKDNNQMVKIKMGNKPTGKIKKDNKMGNLKK